MTDRAKTVATEADSRRGQLEPSYAFGLAWLCGPGLGTVEAVWITIDPPTRVTRSAFRRAIISR